MVPRQHLEDRQLAPKGLLRLSGATGLLVVKPQGAVAACQYFSGGVGFGVFGRQRLVESQGPDQELFGLPKSSGFSEDPGHRPLGIEDIIAEVGTAWGLRGQILVDADTLPKVTLALLVTAQGQPEQATEPIQSVGHRLAELEVVSVLGRQPFHQFESSPVGHFRFLDPAVGLEEDAQAIVDLGQQLPSRRREGVIGRRGAR